MKKIILIASLLVFSISLAQESGGVVENNAEYVNNVFKTKKKDYSDIPYNGTPYYKEEFASGKIILHGKDETAAFMRYNAYSDEIEVQDGENSTYTLLKRDYITTLIGKDAYKIVSYINKDGDIKKGYFITKSKGDIELLFKPSKTLNPSKEPSSSFEDFIPATFVDKNVYYLKRADAPAERIKLKKKSILAQMGDKKQEVSKFLAKNKLNLKKEADLMKLVNYYSSL